MIERVSGLPSASLYERRNLFDLYDESDRVSRSLYNDIDECAMRNEPARRCVDAWRIVVRKARYCAGRKMFAVSWRLRGLQGGAMPSRASGASRSCCFALCFRLGKVTCSPMSVQYSDYRSIDITEFDAVVVGCGFAGSVVAHELADRADMRVLIIEKRSHIGGNMYDEIRPAGGARSSLWPAYLSYTDNNRVFTYLRRFSGWIGYQHKSSRGLVRHVSAGSVQ